MSYPTDSDDYKEAEDPKDNAGACPPYLLKYRIYPEINFDNVFGNPPPNVQP